MDGKRMTWKLSSEHTLPQRARVMAEMALADLVNADALGMVEKAAFRIADAIATYERLDAGRPAIALERSTSEQPNTNEMAQD